MFILVVTRKRRRTLDRNPLSRVELWDRKLEPETYGRYLLAVKPLALRYFAEYQVVHEELIKIVKQVLSKYPEESSRQHAYMWYAQGIWYITQRYRDKARQKEADALFMYWYMLGLKEEPMREIALRLGIKISDWDYLLDPLAMPVSQIVKTTIDELLSERKVYNILNRTLNIPAFITPITGKLEISEAKEYLLIDTAEHIETPVIHFIEGFVDASRSNVDLVFTYYIKVHAESDYIEYYSTIVSLAEVKEAIYLTSRPSYFGAKITIKPVNAPSTPFIVYYTLFIRKVK